MPATLLFRLLLAALLIAGLLGETAYAQNTTYNASQSNREFRSKHGNFTFNGKAVKREGEYVQFRTTDRTEIWLPVKYLSDDSLDYLKYLSGQGPAPSGVNPMAAAPTDLAGTPSGNSSFGSGSGSMNGGASDDSSGSSSTGDDGSTQTSAKPATPTKGDPNRIFATNTPIEVLVDGQWVSAKLFARRPSDNAYYVSYVLGGRPKTVWTPAEEIRAKGEGEATSSDPMDDASSDGGSSDDDSPSSDMSSSDLSSSDFENVVITAKDPIGYEVGRMNKGDVLTVRYVSGKWKTWGGLATASPDDENVAGGDKCRMGICAALEFDVIQKLALVPGQTADNPFSWTADRNYERIILQVNDDDGDFASNPDRDVTYAIAIQRAGS